MSRRVVVPGKLRRVHLGQAETTPAASLLVRFFEWAAAMNTALQFGAVRPSPPMTVVPWGIVLEEEPVRWAEVHMLRHTARHPGPEERDARQASSTLYVEARLKRLVGSGVTGNTIRAFSSVGAYDDGLEGIDALWPRFRAECRRDFVLSLDDSGATVSQTSPDGAREIMVAAQEYLTLPEATDQLGLPTGGYRGAARLVATPITIERLGRALSSPDGLDPAPFAAVLAAELDAQPLLPSLIDLVLSPSPIVAAISRAAALRLGARPGRVGSLEEIQPFITDDVVRDLRSWTTRTPASRS
jgi:hypothetical protein